MFKNVASQKIEVLAWDTSANAPKTGDAANITVYLMKDGGSVTALTDTSATEMSSSNAPGIYQFDVSQTESNADMLLFTGKSTTANITIVPVRILTRPSGFTGLNIASNAVDANVTRFGGSAGTFASGRAEVNATHISGDSTAGTNLKTAYNDTAGAVPWNRIVDQGTAQAATSTTLQLRAAASFADLELYGCLIVITGGTTGVGQVRKITNYVGSTDTATVDAWQTTPTGTITYKVIADAPLSTSEISSILTTQVDGTTTVQQSLKLANAANGGKVSGGGTTTVTIRDLADSKNRVSATVDSNGNRSAVTLDLS